MTKEWTRERARAFYVASLFSNSTVGGSRARVARAIYSADRVERWALRWVDAAGSARLNWYIKDSILDT